MCNAEKTLSKIIIYYIIVSRDIAWLAIKESPCTDNSLIIIISIEFNEKHRSRACDTRV